MTDRVEVITSVERRRCFTDEEKSQIVLETLQPAVNISAIARKHGISPSQLFQWRKRLAKREGVAPLPAVPAFTPVQGEKPEAPAVGEIFIHLGDDVVVELPASIEPRRLAAIARALRS